MIGKVRRQQGFSLLETLIVIAVMSILAGITMIKSFGSMESYRANAALDVIASQLRVARQIAISQRRNVKVTLNTGDFSSDHHLSSSTRHRSQCQPRRASHLNAAA